MVHAIRIFSHNDAASLYAHSPRPVMILKQHVIDVKNESLPFETQIKLNKVVIEI